MRRSLALAAAATTTLTLGLAACGSDGGSDDAASDTDETVAPATSVAAGSCPGSTEIEVASDDGTESFTAASAYADVTLDESATVLITSYEIDEATAESIYQPSLDEGQFGVTFYLSATDGGTLETGTYVETTADGSADLVVNTHSAYSGDGRIIATGANLPESVVEITEITDSQVCGTVTTAEFSGDFAATRI